MEEFDPYHKWLGIPRSQQPPDHYRLLGIAQFEADPDVIEAAADRQMTYVSQCATGAHLKLSQKLLNELSAARVCLLVTAKKQAYDAQLKVKLDQAQRLENSMAPVPLDEPEPTFSTEQFEFSPVAQREQPSRKSRSIKKGSKKSKNAIPIGIGIVGLFVVILLVGGSLMRGKGNTQVAKPDSPTPPTITTPSKTVPDDVPATIGTKPTVAAVSPVANSNPAPAVRHDGPALEILEARYGARATWVDLTDRVRTASASGVVGLVVDSSLVGADPLPGVPKQLVLRYRVDGHPREHVARDFYAAVVIDTRPSPELSPSGELTIHEAQYGDNILGEGEWMDLADRMNAKIQNGQFEVPVDEIIRGLPGKRILIVRWSVHGQVWTSPFEKGDVIRLGPQVPAVQNLEAIRKQRPSGRDLNIIEVTYGRQGTWIDLTDRIRESAKSGFVAFMTNGTTSIQDPVPDTTKTCRLRYELNGRLYDCFYHEGSFAYVDSRTLGPIPKSGLKILHALCGQGIFGDGSGKMVDITDHLQLQVRGDKLVKSIDAALQDSGVQIRPRWLMIRYALNGEIQQVVLDENNDIRLGE